MSILKNLTVGLVAVALGVIVLGAIAISPAQAAVTNPASNPHRIEVLGDDGQTYVDGQDTLPGFDDEACTYIPGAYFDFANNRVHYADGQSIPWTEWDRATGYSEWLAKQGQSTPTSTATPTTSKPPRPTASQSASSSAGAGDSVSPSPTSTDPAGVVGSTPNPASTDAAIAEQGAITSDLGVTQTLALDTANNPGPAVGYAILAFLTGAGVLTYLGHGLRRHTSRRGTA